MQNLRTITKDSPKIELDVAYVGTGGNTGEGKYFFSYDPNVVIVVESGIDMSIFLTDATAESIGIGDFITSDALNQIASYAIASDGRSVTFHNTNTDPYVIQVVLMLHDTDAKHPNVGIVCDPQVINRPRPPQ